MPTLIIKTNAPIDTASQQPLLQAASAMVAQMLGKPERYVMVILEPVPAMYFGGDASPLAYLELKSLDLPEEHSADYSATLCRFVEQHLGVPPTRVYIELASPPRHMFGFDGRTF